MLVTWGKKGRVNSVALEAVPDEPGVTNADGVIPGPVEDAPAVGPALDPRRVAVDHWKVIFSCLVL